MSTSGPGMLAGCAGAGGGPLGLLARLDDDGAVSWAHSLTSNWGVESLFALTTDAAENLLGVGQVFAPLPQIGSEGFVFKTDDLRFNAPSCCTQAEALDSRPVALEATAVSLEEGLTFSLNDVSVSQLTAFLTTTPVCQEEAAPTIVLSDTLICPGQCIEVSATGVPAGATPRWIFPGGAPDTVDIAGPVTACFDQAGDYQIQLIVDNCSRAARLLKVEQQTPPAFTLSDSLICPGECLETSAPSPPEGLSYVWVFQGAEPDSSFATTPPPACYPEGGQYRIELWYEGCGQTSQTVNVRYLPPGIPNAFTPNGDGLNDTFSPIFTCEVDNYDLQVYNRWGQKIFQSNQPADSWDGAFEGKPAHSEVYFWMLSYNEVLNGQVVGQKMQGDVTLLR
ncbi:MAG: gliding motility-associated C-terminal domain-containing protein [Lewinellaceae bacterium]|nr:gliding motility-associated C-terminal domain-containing protein [Lewinellaceae bacterium]